MATPVKQLVSRLVSKPTQRAISTSATKFTASWQQHGVVGATLPFKVNSHARTTVLFALFFGTGLNLPFLLLYHQLTKK